MLDDKYLILSVLGEGGMGKVYAAKHQRIGRRLAIKFLLPEFASRAHIVRRFENEARAAGSLEHENIAVVHDFGRAPDGACYLVMEHLKGHDCAALLERQGRLPVKRALDLVVQTCRGLEVAHREGIVHRDLKPGNLFICQRADGSDLVKVLDFGIAKLRPEVGASATATGEQMGTAYYMSPEQAMGQKNVDQRTDIYALGVILYELLSGVRPHEGESAMQVLYRLISEVPKPLQSLRPDLPPGLSAVVERAMANAASDRFATISELARALLPYLGTATLSGALPRTLADSPPYREPSVLDTEIANVGPGVPATQPMRHDAPGGTAPPISRTSPNGARPAGAGGKRGLIAVAALVASGAALAAFALPHLLAPESSAHTQVTSVQPPPVHEDITVTPRADMPPPLAAAVARASVEASPSAAPATPVPSSAAPSDRPKGHTGKLSPAIAAKLPASGGAVAASAPSKAPLDCDPDYYFDERGQKRFKEHCF